MLGAFRQFAVRQALRASVPRTQSARWASQSLKWQPPSTQTPALSRSLHASFPALQAGSSATAPKESSPQTNLDDGPITKFEDLNTRGLIDPMIIRNITHPSRMGLTTMTEVQTRTVNEMLKGEDVLAQAKTGTGKTLAFLLPSMQNILSDPTLQRRDSRSRTRATADSTDIRGLIISPTRELAEQIAEEARKVAHGTGLIVQTAVGGTQKRAGLMKIQREGCHLLIGTPGRIKDIFSDHSSGVSAPKLNTLILDEADRLLDQGFSAEINEILYMLPAPYDVDRQTLMLSATVPKAVMSMVERTLKPTYTFVKTVRDNETPTHLKVPQKRVALQGYENALPAVLEIAKNYQAQLAQDRELRPFKAIVYFNSTVEVNLAAEVFAALPREPTERGSRPVLGRTRLLEIHSRLTQAQRTFSANAFRNAPEAILFSSDVTARGMDFPDVTHVIQVGPPRDRETYIHRLGRTARANKTGEGWILYHPDESDDFLTKLGDLPLVEDATLATASVDLASNLGSLSSSAIKTIDQVKQAMRDIPTDVRAMAYRSLVGVAVGTFSNKRAAIQALNRLALHGYGLTEPPSISPVVARNLGLSHIRDVSIGHGPARPNSAEDNQDRRFIRGTHKSGDRFEGKPRDRYSNSREGNVYGSRSRSHSRY
ncbi:ATP-dependent RNA helicase [Penicillium hispanicum]|uniref:ATP-dependent RNA helicase n=1 Tax=Penicillium hispanicum TaxID=1080232 RepID=UPI0025416EA4|nr:ATP-dependent RNA helicase [Penicillium hispanicum]KAJ5578578.1 ATP-dependent RNA helicase [Penicillium hispanicum]